MQLRYVEGENSLTKLYFSSVSRKGGNKVLRVYIQGIIKLESFKITDTKYSTSRIISTTCNKFELIFRDFNLQIIVYFGDNDRDGT